MQLADFARKFWDLRERQWQHGANGSMFAAAPIVFQLSSTCQGSSGVEKRNHGCRKGHARANENLPLLYLEHILKAEHVSARKPNDKRKNRRRSYGYC
jgi:hypothetical protein